MYKGLEGVGRHCRGDRRCLLCSDDNGGDERDDKAVHSGVELGVGQRCVGGWASKLMALAMAACEAWQGYGRARPQEVTCWVAHVHRASVVQRTRTGAGKATRRGCAGWALIDLWLRVMP
jgi:hypothetical protein